MSHPAIADIDIVMNRKSSPLRQVHHKIYVLIVSERILISPYLYTDRTPVFHDFVTEETTYYAWYLFVLITYTVYITKFSFGMVINN